MSTTSTFFREQLFGRMVDTTTPLDGGTVIITGSNVGIGFSAALQIAKLNPSHLILAVRDISRGNAAADKIRAATGYKGRLEVWELDLASFESWSVTKDGWERSLQVNDISTGLLAVSLLPVLAKTAKNSSDEFKPAMTIVGSEVHMWSAFKEKATPGSILAALNDEDAFDGADRYMLTKLLNLFIARKLASLPLAADVRVSMVNPGLCASELLREWSWFGRWIMNLLARTTEQGAKNLVWAAVECHKPFAYVSVCKVSEPSPWSSSAEGLAVEHKVWEELTAEWVKLAPEVATTLRI
ncbi:hypothetical protein MNV49_004164 [Pseudohyphozyma bogoriensis]|nr:hypothetical protein MNV49_004164 [Pseudohyphozyma bogoriensis]